MSFLTQRDHNRRSDSEGRILPPRGVTIRRGTAEDELNSFDVMRRTMSADMSWSAHSAMRHHLRNSPNASFWLAEETPRFGSPRLVGYARAIVRDAVWSLTEFFVVPSQHRQGVGGSLLSHCLVDGDHAGADTRMVLASHHPDADSLYIRKANCYPRLPMMLLSGSSTSLRAPDPQARPIRDDQATGFYGNRPGTVADLTDVCASPIILTETILEEFNALDREIVGYARPTEHRFWAEQMGGDRGAARLFRRRTGGLERIVGYSYIGPVSSGPTLAYDTEDLPRFFFHVSGLARQLNRSGFDLTGGFIQQADQYCAVAGTNEIMLNWLLSSGWQIVFQYLFMSSRPLGKMERYVCHNPLYVL